MKPLAKAGIKPREGLKYCRKCRYTQPLLAFYKCDYEVEDALCIKHKKQERKRIDIYTTVEEK